MFYLDKDVEGHFRAAPDFHGDPRGHDWRWYDQTAISPTENGSRSGVFDRTGQLSKQRRC